MGSTSPRSSRSSVWRLAARQHGVVTRSQLVELGFGRNAIQHRLERGRLYSLWRGAYVVGRADVSERGRWMAAVLCCGPGARLSHHSAACLWGMRRQRRPWIDVLVPEGVATSISGIKTHQRRALAAEPPRLVDRIPVSDPVTTLVDLAACVDSDGLEEAVNEADRLGLVEPEKLRTAIQSIRKRRGLGRLRELLDRQTYRVTHSVLEREFLRLVRGTELSMPQTQVNLNGYRVDFYWPELGLVVETDGLRHHHTASQQTTDRRRDQVHTAAGRTTLRFTTAQVRFQPEAVRTTLTSVAKRLSSREPAA